MRDPMFRLADIDLAPEEIATLAGLVHVNRADTGWTRRRCGRGLSYRNTSGKTLRGADRRRAESLAIPPAWTDVWICPSPDGHLQAAGMDDAGRWQYLYHTDFRAEAERLKYLRLGPFGLALEVLRRTVAKDLLRDRGSRRRMCAGAVRLIDIGLIRVGSDSPEDPEDAVGATTLPPDCVTVDLDDGTVELAYNGKGGKQQHCVLEDPPLAHVVAEGQQTASDRLFVYREGDELLAVTAEKVNRYLADITGEPFTAKDFRTWGGSVVVAEHLARSGPPVSDDEAEMVLLEGVDRAADKLGNTRAVARASYVSPIVTDAYRDGTLQDTWSGTRSGKWAARAERVVTRLHASVEAGTGSVRLARRVG